MYQSNLGIPKGQLIRARNICSYEMDFKRNADKLANKLEIRGYDKQEVRDTLDAVTKNYRGSLRQRKIKTKKRDDRTMFISTYDYHSNIIQKTIMRAWHILKSDVKHGHLFRENPWFIYRKGKTIGNSLVRSNLEVKNRPPQVMSYKKRHLRLPKLSKLFSH